MLANGTWTGQPYAEESGWNTQSVRKDIWYGTAGSWLSDTTNAVVPPPSSFPGSSGSVNGHANGHGAGSWRESGGYGVICGRVGDIAAVSSVALAVFPFTNPSFDLLLGAGSNIVVSFRFVCLAMAEVPLIKNTKEERIFLFLLDNSHKFELNSYIVKILYC